MSYRVALSFAMLMTFSACDACVGEGCDGSGTGDDCDGMSEGACSVAPQCTEMLALPLEGQSDEDWCKEETILEYVGCMSTSVGCDDALTLGQDSQGNGWEFPNSCLPGGIVQVSWRELEQCEG